MQNDNNKKAQSYQKMVKKRAPKSQTLIMCIKGVFSGRYLLLYRPIVHDAGESWFHLDDKDVAAFTAMVMVFLGAR
jgi:hypothetical protein